MSRRLGEAGAVEPMIPERTGRAAAAGYVACLWCSAYQYTRAVLCDLYDTEQNGAWQMHLFCRGEEMQRAAMP